MRQVSKGNYNPCHMQETTKETSIELEVKNSTSYEVKTSISSTQSNNPTGGQRRVKQKTRLTKQAKRGFQKFPSRRSRFPSGLKFLQFQNTVDFLYFEPKLNNKIQTQIFMVPNNKYTWKVIQTSIKQWI